MFNSLRNKFIITTMSIISVILIMSFVAIYVSASYSLGRKAVLPPSITVVDADNGIIGYFQQQRDEYVRRAMNELLATLILAGSITLIAVYFVSRNIADRAISPIEEAYEKQRQFVADASHELKTPITIIGANIDAAIADSKKPSEWLENIRSEADRSGRLVNDLLMLARLDIDQATTRRARFSIAKVCEDLVEQFAILANEKDIKMKGTFNGVLNVVSDEDRLRQVVAILLDNAIKHTEDGGQVMVRAYRKKGAIVVEVENPHDDISREKLDLLFERFYQGDDSHSRGGTGLGLSIARRICQQMKWTLEPTSRGGKVAFTLCAPDR